MKKLFISMLLVLVLLTACSTGNTHESSSVVESEIPDTTTNTNSISISDEDVYKIFFTLREDAFPVLYWYLSDTSDDLNIAAESEHAPYYKVGKFSTIDEMKAATDAIFTADFADQFFYDHAFVSPSGGDPMYKEIDGELYRNMDMGGIGWPFQPTEEYDIPYQDDEMIVVGMKTLLPGDEIRWYNFILRNNDGAWKLDTYYELNPHMQYSNAFPKQKESELSAAVSSWFGVRDWTDANQLSANSLINFYMYTYLSDVQEEYDYQVGYEVPAADLMQGLSVYLNDLKMETLIAINQEQGANAHYDEKTDSFYFDITFDPANYIVTASENKENITTLEIMVIGKSDKAVYTSFLDLEVSGSEIKFVGNRCGEKFTE